MNDDPRALAERLFPELEIRSFVPLDEGWDVATYEVNGDLVLQLPRSDRAQDRLRIQMEVLPELARELSAPIPSPEMVSTDLPALVYPKLRGLPADQGPAGIWPERLGRFLYDLHLVPLEFVGMRGVSPSTIRELLREELRRVLDLVRPSLVHDEAARGEALLSRFLDEDRLWSFATCLTHGNLVPQHVLVGAEGDLVGVVGWEEVDVGDPASDFAWWLHARPGEGERALAAYGGAPDATFLERARSLFAFMPWYEVEHGLATHREELVTSALAQLRARLP